MNRPKHKMTIVDKILGVLLIIAAIISIILDEPKIFAWIIVVSLVHVNIREYYSKKNKEL